MQLFKRRQEHKITRPWTQIPLTQTQYERFLDQLKQDPELWAYAECKIRCNYDPGSMLLSVSIPSPIHDYFIDYVVREIMNQLMVISHGGDSSAEFAAQIDDGRSSRILMKEDNLATDAQGAGNFHRREPDGQFSHPNAKYPGVVLEVFYANYGKDMKKLAWDYIRCSKGDINVFIGFDIKYGSTKEATLSVWRPRYIHEEGEELDILQTEQTIVSEPFRAADGSLVNPDNVLCLSLDDFAPSAISTKMDLGNSAKINVTYKALAQFLKRAEDTQEIREGSSGIVSTRKIQEGKYSFNSV